MTFVVVGVLALLFLGYLMFQMDRAPLQCEICHRLMNKIGNVYICPNCGHKVEEFI